MTGSGPGSSRTVISGDWKVSQQKQYKPDGRYGVVPMPGPEGPAPHASWAGGWSWAVPKGYADIPTAFDVISYFCGVEGQTKYNKDTYHIPTLKKVAEDPYFREDPLHAVFMDLLPGKHAILVNSGSSANLLRYLASPHPSWGISVFVLVMR